ncbi:ice-binding family protein [Candidatus Deferrimicrobium sp.]|uniref:ice-binding family protein n=1 Tax=Candidatus Deferrimicrobium sp. TaxID=3060586 RepID=UPI00271FBAC9|nr:ice-binding family protein [Candidatus Deferrimicrobium sp.]MDO8739616.1 ice-binding family protein [Candidatus Deferrimicrobium sp.]
MRNISKEMSQISEGRIVSKMKCKFLIPFVVAAMAALLSPPSASALSILGTAENFAVLAGTPNITNTGTTTITGDVGIHPGAELTGHGSIILTRANDAIHLGDSSALTAKNDLTTAYTALNLMPATQTLVSPELGGATLTSGVYAFQGNPAAVLLTGMLTLDAQGNNNAYWVFQIPNALTTATGSSVVVNNFGSNGGNDAGLFWVVGSSAALDTTTSFEGNILASTSITLNNSATILNGRALAQTGTVTMDTNTISIVCPTGGAGNGGPGYSGGLVYDSAGRIVPTVPIPSAVWLLGSGLLGLVGLKRRSSRKA